MRTLRWWHVLSVTVAVLALSGCTRAAPAQPVRLQPNPVVPVEMPSVEPTATLTQVCLPQARFVKDLTVPDGTQVLPGAEVDKQWAVENNGSCDWGPGYQLRPFGDNPFVGNRADQLYPARAGEQGLWRVQFTAPSEPGEYIGEWQAVTPQGQPFGDSVFLLLIVAEQ